MHFTINENLFWGILAMSIIVCGLFVFLAFKLINSERKRKNILSRLAEVESRFGKMNLPSIETRLSPHLLKNIFNSIQSHAYQTYFAIDKLAGVLDYILYESQKKFVSPKDEIEFALSLIEINKIKLSPLFELKIKTRVNETEPLYEQNLIAPLISVDLIENAFKHADLQSSEAFISITFEFKKNVFSLMVANKISQKPPIKKEKSGLGSQTLEQRLNLIYGDCFELHKVVEDNVFIANLKINLLDYKTKMLTSGR